MLEGIDRAASRAQLYSGIADSTCRTSRSREHGWDRRPRPRDLAPSDQMITRTRRRLLMAAARCATKACCRRCR